MQKFIKHSYISVKAAYLKGGYSQVIFDSNIINIIKVVIFFKINIPKKLGLNPFNSLIMDVVI